ncbi:MAG: HEAT repeat domain-containing protein [bacterium]|nr:HEAT repeat domain-containing protein [bacterium]
MSRPVGAAPADAKRLAAMLEFVHRTVSLRRAFVLYGPGNAMYAGNIEGWRQAADLFFTGQEGIELTGAGRALFFGDTLMPGGSPFVRDLAENFRRLIIRRISIQAGIDEAELRALMEMLSRDSRGLLLKGGAAAFLRERGVKSAAVIENVYLRREGGAGEATLDEASLTDDDLAFIRRQIKNMIALARDGFALRGEERGLLTEAAEHPTFMGELLKEMAGEAAGPEGTLAARADAMSEVLDVLAGQIRKGGARDEAFARQAFSGMLSAVEEPLRLEVLRAQFDDAGQLPPVLDEDVYGADENVLVGFIVDLFRRDPGAPARLRPLTGRLMGAGDEFGRLLDRIGEACREGGLDAAPLARALEEGARSVSRTGRPPAPPAPGGAAPGGLPAALPPDFGERFRKALAECADVETAVLSELLRAGAVTTEFAGRVAARIAELAAGGTDAAWGLLRALIDAAKSGGGAAAPLVSGIVWLFTGGAARPLLDSPVGAEEKAAAIADIIGIVPPPDAAAVWGALAGGAGESPFRDLLVEAGRREPKAVGEVLRAQAASGRWDVLSRSLEVLEALPAEISSPLMLDLCRHPEAKVRARAVGMLGRSGLAEAPMVLDRMTADGDPDVRRAAIPFLGLVGGERALPRLIEIAEGARDRWDAEDRVLACRALGRSGRREAVRPLAALLERAGDLLAGEGGRHLRASIRFALESIGGEEARAALDRDARRGTSPLRRLFGGR